MYMYMHLALYAYNTDLSTAYSGNLVLCNYNVYVH